MRLPNIVHLGFAKCGSTFLQAFWRNHPQVHLVFKSNFFGPFDECDFDLGASYYARHFAAAHPHQLLVESDEHLLMPVYHPKLHVRGITPESVDEICRRLKHVVPNAKLVLVIRNQLELLVSTYSQYLLGGGTLSLHAFAEELIGVGGSGGYFYFHYDEIIERLQENFPGKLKVILSEEMARDTSQQLRELCHYMTIPSYDFKPSFKDRRIGLSKFGMNFVRTLNRCLVRNHAARIEPELWIPKKLYKSLCNSARVVEHYCVNRFAQVKKSDLATTDIIEFVKSEYSESNRRLAMMLDKDLTQWNYLLPTSPVLERNPQPTYAGQRLVVSRSPTA